MNQLARSMAIELGMTISIFLKSIPIGVSSLASQGWQSVASENYFQAEASLTINI
jgi:hypothetical protein